MNKKVKKVKLPKPLKVVSTKIGKERVEKIVYEPSSFEDPDDLADIERFSSEFVRKPVSDSWEY
jgi:hypothetical protein